MRPVHPDRPASAGRDRGAGPTTSRRLPQEPVPREDGRAPDELTDEDLGGFLDLPGELFGVFDPRQNSVWCSSGVAQVLGYQPGELQEVDLATLVHPDDLGAPTDDLEDFPRDGAPLTLDVRCRAADGTWRWLEWSGSWDDDAQVLIGAVRDVTNRHLAEERARANERLVSAILDHSTAAISVKDPEGRFTLANDAFLALHGLERDQVVGRSSSEIRGEPGGGLSDVERRVLATGIPTVTDDLLDVAGARHVLMTVRFPVSMTHAPATDRPETEGPATDRPETETPETGVPETGVAAIATDVTERTAVERALAARERVLDTIFRACPDIVCIIGADGHVEEVSTVSPRILGFAVGDDGGEGLLESVHPDDVERIESALVELLALERRQLDFRVRVRHLEGHWVTLDTRAQALVADDGTSAGAVLVSRDVSADLAFEEELQAAAAAAEQASTDKSTFLSRMSHELRTPLNSILGFAQLLELEPLDAQQHDAARHVIRAGRHLLGLIDEVLDIARIESGRLDVDLGPTLLRDVVTDAVDFTRPQAEDRQVSLVVDFGVCADDTYVLADRQRLLQVLLNLLSNGVKYNHAGGTVLVSVSRRRGRTQVLVRDTGPGIDPADMHRVFLPFDRIGAERSGVQGTGVGLTLSKHLVEEMGGTIQLESGPGEGAAFTVSLVDVPAPGPSLPALGVARRGAPAPDGLHVLHIEDNQANLELVEQVLARVAGVDLRAAMTGGLGLELAKEDRPDLVLLDLHLPDLPGSEVLARLRADSATAQVPVVVVSADATPTTVRQLRSDGVLAFLSKPIDVHELLHIVESLAVGAG